MICEDKIEYWYEININTWIQAHFQPGTLKTTFPYVFWGSKIVFLLVFLEIHFKKIMDFQKNNILSNIITIWFFVNSEILVICQEKLEYWYEININTSIQAHTQPNTLKSTLSSRFWGSKIVFVLPFWKSTPKNMTLAHLHITSHGWKMTDFS